MKIKSVTIEGLHNVDYKKVDLGDITYLHGLNGAGKSTILQAIQLGLLGYIPGTNKTKEAIFQHCNGNKLSVKLEFVGDGKVEIERTWMKNRGAILSLVNTTPDDYDPDWFAGDVELPIFNFSEFIGLTPNKLKDWFLNFLPSSETHTDWKTVLKEDLKGIKMDARVQKFVEDYTEEILAMNASGLDEIRKANEFFKSALSFKKKELERVEGTIQSLIHYDDIDALEDEDEIRNKILVLEQKRDAIKHVKQTMQNNSRINAQLADYQNLAADSYLEDDGYKKLIEEHDKLVTTPVIVVDRSEDLKALTDESITIKAENSMMSKIVSSNGICPFTSTKCDSVSKLVEEYKEKIQKNNLRYDEISKQISEINAKKQEENESKLQLRSKLIELKSQMDGIRSRYAQRDLLKSQLVEVDDLGLDLDEDCDSKIQELKDLWVKISANKKYDEMIDVLTKDKFEIETDILIYKSWINLTGVNGLQNQVGESNPFDDLAEKMNKYLNPIFGDNSSAYFNLETKSNSFSFGLLRENEYTPYNLLSSGEKCMFALSMMIGLMEFSDAPVRLVMIDDMFDHLDDEKFIKLFDILGKESDIQLLFAGVKPIDRDCVVEVN